MNHKKSISSSFIFLVIIFCIPFVASSKTEVSKLLCEYKTNPVGIDVVQPRFSWQLSSDEQNVMQSAYEIRVAANKNDLSNKNKLLWNTGKVASGESVNVEYKGPAVGSGERVWWQNAHRIRQGRPAGHGQGHQLRLRALRQRRRNADLRFGDHHQ